jgi:hypothetical protein
MHEPIFCPSGIVGMAAHIGHSILTVLRHFSESPCSFGWDQLYSAFYAETWYQTAITGKLMDGNIWFRA